MRKLLLISFLLMHFVGYSQPMSMLLGKKATSVSYVFKNSVKATANSPYATVTTASVDMTGATEIWIATSDYVGSSVTAPTPTDNLGNTYTFVRSQTQGGSPRINLYVKYGATVSSSMTFTYPSTSNSYPGIIALGFSGTATSAPDQNNGANWGGLSGTVSKQTGAITPSLNNSLIIVAANVFIATATPTIDLGFSSPVVFQQSNASQTYSMMMSYLIQGTAASTNPTITFTPLGSNACGVIANSKPN